MSASDSSRNPPRYIQTTAVQPELDIAPGFDSFSTPTYRGSTIVFRSRGSFMVLSAADTPFRAT